MSLLLRVVSCVGGQRAGKRMGNSGSAVWNTHKAIVLFLAPSLVGVTVHHLGYDFDCPLLEGGGHS